MSGPVPSHAALTRKESAFLLTAGVGAVLFVAAFLAMLAGAPDPTGPSEDPLVLRGADLLALAGSIYIVAPVLILGTLWLMWKRRWWGAAKLALIPLAGELTVRALKLLVARNRPPNPFEDSFSFPSGHATNAAIFACLAAWFAFREPRGRATILALLLGGASWALVMAADRLALGVHYLSDVVAGVGLGLMIGGAGLAWLSWLQRRASS